MTTKPSLLSSADAMPTPSGVGESDSTFLLPSLAGTMSSGSFDCTSRRSSFLMSCQPSTSLSLITPFSGSRRASIADANGVTNGMEMQDFEGLQSALAPSPSFVAAAQGPASKKSMPHPVGPCPYLNAAAVEQPFYDSLADVGAFDLPGGCHLSLDHNNYMQTQPVTLLSEPQQQQCDMQDIDFATGMFAPGAGSFTAEAEAGPMHCEVTDASESQSHWSSGRSTPDSPTASLTSATHSPKSKKRKSGNSSRSIKGSSECPSPISTAASGSTGALSCPVTTGCIECSNIAPFLDVRAKPQVPCSGLVHERVGLLTFTASILPKKSGGGAPNLLDLRKLAMFLPYSAHPETDPMSIGSVVTDRFGHSSTKSLTMRHSLNIHWRFEGQRTKVTLSQNGTIKLMCNRLANSFCQKAVHAVARMVRGAVVKAQKHDVDLGVQADRVMVQKGSAALTSIRLEAHCGFMINGDKLIRELCANPPYWLESISKAGQGTAGYEMKVLVRTTQGTCSMRLFGTGSLQAANPKAHKDRTGVRHQQFHMRSLVAAVRAVVAEISSRKEKVQALPDKDGLKMSRRMRKAWQLMKLQESSAAQVEPLQVA